MWFLTKFEFGSLPWMIFLNWFFKINHFNTNWFTCGPYLIWCESHNHDTRDCDKARVCSTYQEAGESAWWGDISSKSKGMAILIPKIIKDMSWKIYYHMYTKSNEGFQFSQCICGFGTELSRSQAWAECWINILQCTLHSIGSCS